MAYREIGMWEIHEVLRRVARGEPQRVIQRATGHSRTTIRRWLRVARKLGWKPGDGEPDEALAVAVAERARPVPAEPSRGKTQERLAPHRKQIQAWLEPEEGICDRGMAQKVANVMHIPQDIEYLQESDTLEKALTLTQVEALRPAGRPGLRHSPRSSPTASCC